MSEPEVQAPHLTPRPFDVWLHRDGDKNLDCEVDILYQDPGWEAGDDFRVKIRADVQFDARGTIWRVERWMLHPKPGEAYCAPTAIPEPAIGIKRDFEPGGLTGEAKAAGFPVAIEQAWKVWMEIEDNAEAERFRKAWVAERDRQEASRPKSDPFEPVMVGIRRWVAANPGHRRAIVELQGDLIVVALWSLPVLPSMVEATVKFAKPETVEGTMLTLDRCFAAAQRELGHAVLTLTPESQ